MLFLVKSFIPLFQNFNSLPIYVIMQGKNFR